MHDVVAPSSSACLWYLIYCTLDSNPRDIMR